MSWVKLDDGFDSHRKIERVSLEATGLYTRALSYCARYETDGVFELGWIKSRVPQKRVRDRIVDELLRVNLIEELTAGEIRDIEIRRPMRQKQPSTVRLGPFEEDAFLVHDYLEFNGSSDEVRAEREHAANKKAQQRERESEKKAALRVDSSESVPGGHDEDSSSPVPSRPVPTRPDPFPHVPSSIEEENVIDFRAAAIGA
jgi:hypothetical protein